MVGPHTYKKIVERKVSSENDSRKMARARRYGRWSRNDDDDTPEGLIPYSIDELRRGGYEARKEYKKILVRQRAATALEMYYSYGCKVQHSAMRHKAEEPTHNPWARVMSTGGHIGSPKNGEVVGFDCVKCEHIRLMKQSRSHMYAQYRGLLKKIGEFKPIRNPATIYNQKMESEQHAK